MRASSAPGGAIVAVASDMAQGGARKVVHVFLVAVSWMDGPLARREAVMP